MRTVLTQVEKLDVRFPGLAEQVRAWFDQGIPIRSVSELLLEHYSVSVPGTTLGNFRKLRWARDRELLRKTKIAARAAHEIALERAIAASLAGETLEG
jgi:hypothetical protein